MSLKVSSAKWRPFWLGLNELSFSGCNGVGGVVIFPFHHCLSIDCIDIPMTYPEFVHWMNYVWVLVYPCAILQIGAQFWNELQWLTLTWYSVFKWVAVTYVNVSHWNSFENWVPICKMDKTQDTCRINKTYDILQSINQTAFWQIKDLSLFFF